MNGDRSGGIEQSLTEPISLSLWVWKNDPQVENVATAMVLYSYGIGP